MSKVREGALRAVLEVDPSLDRDVGGLYHPRGIAWILKLAVVVATEGRVMYTGAAATFLTWASCFSW